ncbi:MAG: asparaginase [Rhizobiales bacterium]|nr:asparaginase [Hyphomicrobiales bacterium]
MSKLDPILVEVTRGDIVGRDFVESYHQGAVAIVRADGEILAEIGDVTKLVYPRSAIKLVQALPMVESGAVNHFGFGAKELALACASHNGEDEHVAAVRHMLELIGLDETAFECGGHAPELKSAQAQLNIDGITPTALHNNCSGKHAGMLALAMHLGIDPKGYSKRGHKVQQEAAQAISDMTEYDLTTAPCGTDGCSIPTYAVPLSNLAHAFAKVADPTGLGESRAAALRRLSEACMSEPFMVAGTERFCTNVMQAFPGIVFAKTGAEGVFCACLPGTGIGIAVKCRDGATRAAEAMTATILEALLKPEGDALTVLRSFSHRPLENWNGIHVGDIRPSEELQSALAHLA